MKKPWVQTIRRESSLIEKVCKCGVGHPAAASVHWFKLHGIKNMEIHGCCGCCQTAAWKLADATEGYEKANEIIKALLKKCKL